MFWITYIYFNFVPAPKQGTRLYFLRKHWEILKQLFEKKMDKNFVSARYIFVKQASIIDEEVEPENELPEIIKRRK